jgi:predicted O-methyltransferase YrrM
LDAQVTDYLETLDTESDSLLDALEAHAAQRGFPLIGRASGRWLTLLAQAVGARRVFEVGSGFGYSAYFFAQAVGPDGEIHGADRDAHELDDHSRLYGDHPFSQRIHIHHGEALEVLSGLPGLFDVILLDCDKAAYVDTLEAVLPRLRTGGLVLADNVLWGGRTARAAPPDDTSTLGLPAFNLHVASHPLLTSAILPVGDGLGVCVKAS